MIKILLLALIILQSTAMYSMHKSFFSTKTLSGYINKGQMTIKKTKKFYSGKNNCDDRRDGNTLNQRGIRWNSKTIFSNKKTKQSLFSKKMMLLSQQNGKNNEKQEKKQQDFHEQHNKNNNTENTTYSERFHRYFDTLPNSVQWTVLATMAAGTLYIFNDTTKNKLPRLEKNCRNKIEQTAIPQLYELIRTTGSSMGIDTDIVLKIGDKKAETVFTSLLFDLCGDRSFMELLIKHQEQLKNQPCDQEILQKLNHILLPKISDELPDWLKGSQFAHKLTQNYAQSLYQFILTPAFLGMYHQFENHVRKELEQHLGTTIKDISALLSGIWSGKFALWLLNPTLLERVQKGKNIALMPTAKITMTAVGLDVIMHFANVILEKHPKTKLYHYLILAYPKILKFYTDYFRTIDPLLADFGEDESYVWTLVLLFKDELTKCQGNLERHSLNFFEEIQNQAFQDKHILRRLFEIATEQGQNSTEQCYNLSKKFINGAYESEISDK